MTSNRRTTFLKGWLSPALLFLIAGCAHIPDSVRTLPEPNVSLELVDTPFFAQERYQCGPAALATVLSASDVAITAEELVGKVYIPGREGSLQLELIAATRMAGRIPYLLDPSLAAIVGELQAGRPVVVLQNLGVSLIPRWHYAVVVGVDANEDIVILRSGTDKRRLTPTRTFLRTWRRSDYWAFIVLQPDELPSNVSREKYFQAVAAMEQVGQTAAAAVAWQTALGRWPNDPTALFGYANSLLALGKPAAAAESYRLLLQIKPDLIAVRNNLAFALAQHGDYDDALGEIDYAIELGRDSDLAPELLDTRRQIQELRMADQQ